MNVYWYLNTPKTLFQISLFKIQKPNFADFETHFFSTNENYKKNQKPKFGVIWCTAVSDPFDLNKVRVSYSDQICVRFNVG